MSQRDRLILAVVASLALIGAAWMLLIQPQRNRAAHLGAQIRLAQQQLQGAQAEAAAARAAAAAYPRNYAMVAQLGEAVPSDDELPSLIYQLQAAATHARVSFQSLALAPSSSSTASTASAPGKAASAAQLPPGATVGPAGFPTMPFTFTFNGDFFRLSNFFARLQRFVAVTRGGIEVRGRLMTVNAITLGPGPKGFPQITATISATTYMLPQSQSASGGAGAGAPGAAGSQGAAPAATGATGSSSSPPLAAASPGGVSAP
jgi:hypothetical protein